MQTSPALYKERVMDTLIFSSNKTISRAVAKKLKQVCAWGGGGYCICQQKLKLSGGGGGGWEWQVKFD